MPRFSACWIGAFFTVLILPAVRAVAADDVHQFLRAYCFDCHDADLQKGGLDLSALEQDYKTARNFAKWVKINDRVAAGEMPPKKKQRPEPSDLKAFTNS